MRGKFTGWPPCQSAARVVGGCTILVLLLFVNVRAEVVDRIVAMVNDDIILLSDLEQMLTVVSGTLDRQGYPASQKRQILNEQRKQVLEQLIYDTLTDQQIQRHGIKIDDDEVDATIAQIRKINKLSETDLHRALELDGISFEAYRKQIKEKVLRTRLVNREVKSKIVITDEDIRSYFDSHQSEYGGATKYELRHLLLKVSPSATSTEKESVYQRIKGLYERLQAGQAFEKVAGQYSEAPSAARNGLLGVFDANLLSDQIKQALQGVDPKQFSEIVDTDQGYQIFYVEGIMQSGGRSLDEVRAEIQQKLYADVVDQKFNEWIKDLRQRSHIQIME